MTTKESEVKDMLSEACDRLGLRFAAVSHYFRVDIGGGIERAILVNGHRWIIRVEKEDVDDSEKRRTRKTKG